MLISVFFIQGILCVSLMRKFENRIEQEKSSSHVYLLMDWENVESTKKLVRTFFFTGKVQVIRVLDIWEN